MRSLQSRRADGQARNTSAFPRAHEYVVHGLLHRLVWECPTAKLQEWHARNVARRHCDVAVGSGHPLPRVHAGVEELTLVDLDGERLRSAAARLAHLEPGCVSASALQPLPSGLGPFDSIGLSCVLHRVPGNLERDKAAAFDHLGRALAPRGVLFGSTVLGGSDAPSLRARALMALYNRRGLFHNEGDTLRGLIHALAERFSEHEVHRVGAVALFAARGYRG